MTESAGVQVGKRPVSVHGGMTERLEIQQLRVLDFAQLFMLQNRALEEARSAGFMNRRSNFA